VHPTLLITVACPAGRETSVPPLWRVTKLVPVVVGSTSINKPVLVRVAGVYTVRAVASSKIEIALL